MWKSINLLASVFGLAALLSYDIIWWAVLHSGGVLHFDPTFGWFETWVEPVLLAIFTGVAVVGLTRHIKLAAAGTSHLSRALFTGISPSTPALLPKAMASPLLELALGNPATSKTQPLWDSHFKKLNLLLGQERQQGAQPLGLRCDQDVELAFQV